MKKKFIFILYFFISLIGCEIYAQVKSFNEKDKIQPFLIKKANKNTNKEARFEKVEMFINEHFLVLNEVNLTINELRFQGVISCMNSGKIMFEKFGMWTTAFKSGDELLLLWNNVKLLPNSEQRFVVITFGAETKNEIYTSFAVLNQDDLNIDCLSEESIFRELLINFFVDSYEKITPDKTFYKLYHKTKNSL